MLTFCRKPHWVFLCDGNTMWPSTVLPGQSPFPRYLFLKRQRAQYRGKLSSPKSICPLHKCSSLSQMHNYMETKIMEKPGPEQPNLSVFGDVIQIPAGPAECVFPANISHYLPLFVETTYILVKNSDLKRESETSLLNALLCQEQAANTSTVSSTYFTMRKTFFSFFDKSLPKRPW